MIGRRLRAALAVHPFHHPMQRGCQHRAVSQPREAFIASLRQCAGEALPLSSAGEEKLGAWDCLDENSLQYEHSDWRRCRDNSQVLAFLRVTRYLLGGLRDVSG